MSVRSGLNQYARSGAMARRSRSTRPPALSGPLPGALPRLLRAALLCLALLAVPLAASAAPSRARAERPREPDDLGGRFEGEVDGARILLPLLKTDLEADVRGDLATVTVRQTFANPTTRAMNATYLFPLHEEAAVYEMVMEVGGERIRARIQEIEQAKKTFEQAKQAGKSAALLTEHRPNMFTQEIANLMPGLPVSVTLKYVQTVPRIDGAYSLVMPLVVGPRYVPGGKGSDGNPAPGRGDAIPTATKADAKGGTAGAGGTWQLNGVPAYPPVQGLDLPTSIDPDRVSIRVRIDAGMPITHIDSDTHVVYSKQLTPGSWDVALAEGRTIDNRDFELRYRLAGQSAQAGMLAYRDARGGFFSLLIEPPAAPSVRDITPREMVYLLDCSGSMDGLPMEASKAFIRRSLQTLRPTDSFRIIRFSDSATEFSSKPLPATPESIQRALAFVSSLQGEGGTEMTSGIRQALSVPPPRGAMRLVVFLTDGYIGNEFEVLGLINANIGADRLFALGVGDGVNRYLLSELGKVGRGFTKFMTVDEDAEAVATELAAKLDAPVLTDLRIDWGGIKPVDLAPEQLRDLFAGQSLRVQGRYPTPGDYQVTIHGKVNGRTAQLPLRVHLPERTANGEAVALVWARSAVAQAMDRLLPTPRGEPSAQSSEALRKYITDLGLHFSLVTRWTAFVAVSERIVNPKPGEALAASVPLPMVDGVGPGAYAAPMQAGSTGSKFGISGGSTPEPTLIGGLIVALTAGASALRRRRRDDDSEG